MVDYENAWHSEEEKVEIWSMLADCNLSDVL